MIKRMKENLKSKKGFTLVELIVVIVIILILAAVMIPNVMRYIGQARESTFQSDASAYLTEIQGFAAEYYAKESKDITAGTSSEITKLLTDETSEYALTDAKHITVSKASNESGIKTANTPSGDIKAIKVWIEKGAVKGFRYETKDHKVSWIQTAGWSGVDKELA